MRTLRLGVTGQDVVEWEHFLLGIDPKADNVADGTFDATDVAATKRFQGSFSLTPDGVVGPMTYAKALTVGLNIVTDDSTSVADSNWPPVPDPSVARALSPAETIKTFGQFAFKSTPQPGNPEAITITDGWVNKNIIHVKIPQLATVKGGPKFGLVACHKLVATQLVSLFAAWESAGLLDRILTFDGMYVPRFVRGSRTSLSNHSYGTAFDINAQWNMLGTRPALLGKKGCVRELVALALEHGFWWGGHFANRADGMHFQAYKVIP